MIAPDNAGGVLATTLNNGVPLLTSVGKTGNSQWQTELTGLISTRWAVHPNNTLFMVRAVNLGVGNGDRGELVKINTVTGQPTVVAELYRRDVTWGRGFYNHPDPEKGAYQTCDYTTPSVKYFLPSFGGIFVAADGSTFVPTVTRNRTYTADCTPSTYEDDYGIHPVPWDGITGPNATYSWESTVEVIKIDSQGQVTRITVDSDFGNGTNWNTLIRGFSVGGVAIPNGTGGVIFPGSDNNATNWIYRTGGSKIAPPIASNGTALAPDEMLLGENSTLYIARDPFFGGGYAALSLSTGAVIWQKTGGVNLVAALNDGSVLVNGSTLSRVDLTGITTDFVGGAGLYAARYAGNELWIGGNDDGGATMVANISEAAPTSGSSAATTSGEASAAAPESSEQDPSEGELWAHSTADGAVAGGNGFDQNVARPIVQLRVAKVIEANVSDSFAKQRIDAGINYWAKQGLVLKWPGTISGVHACPPENPQCALEDYRNILLCNNLDCQREILRRFPLQKGIDILFTQTISGGGSASGGALLSAPLGKSGLYVNKAVFARDADNVAAHELGHVLQLPHVGAIYRNLMCGPTNNLIGDIFTFGCSLAFSTRLDKEQVEEAKRGALIWQD